MYKCSKCEFETEDVRKFNSHGQKHSTKGNRGREAGAEHSRKKHAEALTKYGLNPKKCKGCYAALRYEKRWNSFCSSSCSASTNNVGRARSEESKKKTRDSIQEYHLRNPKPLIDKIPTKCRGCGGPHFGQGKTCSPTCKSQLLSSSLRGITGGSTKSRILYRQSDGRDVFLDSSWELLLANELDRNGVYWERPEKFILSDGRSYTPDFYIPCLDLFLDPKAFRKGYLENVKKIRRFEEEYSVTCLVISYEKFLTWEYILNGNLARDEA